MAHNFGQLCTIFVVVLWELTIAALWQPANVIADAAGRVYIIDWEWAGPGDRLCDLATFCALSEQDDAGELALLARYLGNEATSGAGLERSGGWGAGCSPPTSSRVNTCAVSSQLMFTRTLTRGAGVGRLFCRSAVDRARVRLWRTWFALRGALWARRKATSPHFGAPTGPDDDYHAFAEVRGCRSDRTMRCWARARFALCATPHFTIGRHSLVSLAASTFLRILFQIALC